MNHTKQMLAMILISYAGSSFAAGDEQPLTVKTEGLPAHVAEKVRQKAADGATSLRRYVYITRSMHGLDMRSLVREESAIEIAAARNEKAEKVATTAR
jgi:hypothetical protein